MTRFHHVYKAAKRHHKAVVQGFQKTHKTAHKVLKTYGLDLNDLRHHAVRTVSLASIATGALVGPVYAHSLQSDSAPTVSTQVNTVLQPEQSAPPSDISIAVAGPDIALANKSGLFPQQVNRMIPNPSTILPSDQEQVLQQLVQDTYGITAKTELDGIKLNATYGLVGGEQHLPLYPGDTAANHKTDKTWNLTGMTPGKGAWGYAANSAAELTELDKTREQWYGVVQTFLTPGWHDHVQQYYKWFQHRKMIFINPDTGSAVVVSIEDSGPSPLLDRKFGASNETMDHLNYGLSRKGRIYALFVDDPNNTVPLGPIQ